MGKQDCFGCWNGSSECEACFLETWCSDFTARSERLFLELTGVTREDDLAMWLEACEREGWDPR